MPKNGRKPRYDNSRQLTLWPPSPKIRTLNDEVRELRALLEILTKDVNALRKDVLTLNNSLQK